MSNPCQLKDSTNCVDDPGLSLCQTGAMLCAGIPLHRDGNMKAFARTAVLAFLCLAATAPVASASGSTACPTPQAMPQGRMPWFGGFGPADDLLTAWCRLQTIPGSVKFNVLFPLTKVHKSWETTFQGTTLPPNRIVEIIQSLLPTDKSAPEDPNMPFYRVLENVLQAGAEKAKDGMDIGFAKSHPASQELMLWEPVVLRVKPVVMAGHEFTLNVVLRPNLGMFALGQQGKATDVRLLGAKERMSVGNRFTGTCSLQIPYCEKIQKVATFHAPWLVTGIRLEAHGENLTNTALAIMNQLATSHYAFVKGGDPLSRFNRSTGSGTMILTDGITTMKLEATGTAGGTKKIVILWEEEPSHKQSVSAYMRDIAISYRMSKKPTDEHTVKNPDILDRL